MKKIIKREESELVFPACEITAVGLGMPDDLTFERWEQIGQTLRKIEGARLWWFGDWCNFGERKYGEKYSQALEAGDYEYGTLRDAAWVADRIELSRRRDNCSFSMHREVAPLDEADQDRWLDRAEKEDLTHKELRQLIRDAKRGPTPELPKGKYCIIYADPPWQYDFSETESRAIESKYPTMTVEQIKELPVPAESDAVLFLWATAPKLREALQVLAAWGFEYKTHAVWDKEIIGMGYWFRGQHELLLVGTKGNGINPPEESCRSSSIIREKRTTHSKKPEKVYKIIEAMFPDQNKIELFARAKRDGWTSWGNDV